MARVLIIDDEEPVRKVIERILQLEGHVCAMAGDALQARAALRSDNFDVVLADVNLPGENGLELARSVLETSPDTAVIMVSGVQDRTIARSAIEMGTYGYVVKPFDANSILIGVATALRRRALEIENRAHRQRLEMMVHERTAALQDAVNQLLQSEEEVRRSQEETIRRLAKAAECKDIDTGQHVSRMSCYSELIARRLGLNEERCETIRLASPMHDVGKIATPDNILLKPGKLTADEFAVMKLHAEMGYQILAGSGSALLEMAAMIAWSHHERHDGTGYPRGMAGEAIPLEGRIVAVADVFDALTSRRVYKDAIPIGPAVEVMRRGKGSHFDPAVLDAFLSALDEVEAIRASHNDAT